METYRTHYPSPTKSSPAIAQDTAEPTKTSILIQNKGIETHHRDGWRFFLIHGSNHKKCGLFWCIAKKCPVDILLDFGSPYHPCMVVNIPVPWILWEGYFKYHGKRVPIHHWHPRRFNWHPRRHSRCWGNLKMFHIFRVMNSQMFQDEDVQFSESREFLWFQA